MACAVSHLDNAIFHFNVVRKTLNAYRALFKFRNKNSVNALDVGCGSGRVMLEELLPILPKNFNELIGVDKSHSMVNLCKTLKVDPRVSFQQLDITTRHLPKNLLGKFDFITSFFCLHYARDYDQMLQNMHKMLKKDGELLFIQAYKINPVYHTYRELSRIDTWKQYFEDFADYECPFEGSDPETKLKELFQKNKLNLIKHKFEYSSIELVPRNFIESLKSFDMKKDSIPVDRREEYNRDFHKCFSKVLNFDFVSESSLHTKTDMNYHRLIVYADKS